MLCQFSLVALLALAARTEDYARVLILALGLVLLHAPLRPEVAAVAENACVPLTTMRVPHVLLDVRELETNSARCLELETGRAHCRILVILLAIPASPRAEASLGVLCVLPMFTKLGWPKMTAAGTHNACALRR
jgi:hypothetical protein